MPPLRPRDSVRCVWGLVDQRFAFECPDQPRLGLLSRTSCSPRCWYDDCLLLLRAPPEDSLAFPRACPLAVLIPGPCLICGWIPPHAHHAVSYTHLRAHETRHDLV